MIYKTNLQNLTKGKLWLQVLIAMIAGCLFGILMGPSVGLVSNQFSHNLTSWLAFPGHLFLTLIKMIVVPLVFASIIRGLSSSGDIHEIKQIGFFTVSYFILTTALSILIGIGVTFLIQPGKYINTEMLQNALGAGSLPAALSETNKHTLPTVSEVPYKLIELLPSNPLSALVQADMLQIVIFAMIIGIALLLMKKETARPLLELLEGIQEVCMTVVKWAMHLAPLAVFGLMTQLTSKIGLEALLGMGVYVLTVLLGLFILFLFYILIIFLALRSSPISFISNIREVFLLAFSTSSSAAVMPLSIKTATEKLNIDKKVSQFVIPLGATINMNGTALYQGAATIFLAQVFGVQIELTGILLIIVTAVGASIGSPGTPGVGIAILAMVLSSVGIPQAGVFLIMGVDRILDMARTAVNVTGDIVTCVLAEKWIQRKNG